MDHGRSSRVLWCLGGRHSSCKDDCSRLFIAQVDEILSIVDSISMVRKRKRHTLESLTLISVVPICWRFCSYTIGSAALCHSQLMTDDAFAGCNNHTL